MAHVEIINPREKLSPSLGGTGYLPPSKPMTLAQVDDAVAEAIRAGTAVDGAIMLKVARNSVKWSRPSKSRTRKLNLEDGVCECVVVGGNRDWWFAWVDGGNPQ